MTKVYTKQLIENPENPEELLLDLGLEICEELGWKEGDVLEWIDNGDGTWTIQKTADLKN